MNLTPQPPKKSASLVAEFLQVIADAELEQLKVRDADLMLKAPGRGPVGIQGMILDAMNDGRLESPQAHQLLIVVNQRLNGNSVGLCRITPDGDVMAIGTVLQDAK